MKTEFKNILLLEELQSWDDLAVELWQDIVFLRSTAIRLTYELFHRDGMSPSSIAGRHLMKGFMITVKDNKSVEDIHHPLRLDSNANNNRKLAAFHIQDIIVNSGVLEQRGIPHRVQVTKRAFEEAFNRLKKEKLISRHRPHKHKLPKEWSKILSPNKTWPSLTEDAIERAAAAWAWLHHFYAERGQELPADMSIGQSMLTKFVPNCQVLEETSNRGTVRLIASLGNARWAALVLPLRSFEHGGVTHYEFYRAPVEFIFVTGPTKYRVVPVQASRVEGHGITMAKEGEPEPLVQFALRNPDKIKLTDADLRRIATFLDLENITESTPINDLLTALSNFSELDAEHIRKMYWQGQADDDGCELLKDPLMECVYNDLDQGDKDEFKEVGKMIKKRKFKIAMGTYMRKRSSFARHPTAKRRKKRPTPDGPEGPAPPDGIGAPQRPPLAADEPPAGAPLGPPAGGLLALAANEAVDFGSMRRFLGSRGRDGGDGPDFQDLEDLLRDVEPGWEGHVLAGNVEHWESERDEEEVRRAERLYALWEARAHIEP